MAKLHEYSIRVVWRCSIKKFFLRISQNWLEKNLYHSLFLNEVAACRSVTLFKKRSRKTIFFAGNFEKYVRIPILQNICFPEKHRRRCLLVKLQASCVQLYWSVLKEMLNSYSPVLPFLLFILYYYIIFYFISHQNWVSLTYIFCRRKSKVTNSTILRYFLEILKQMIP